MQGRASARPRQARRRPPFKISRKLRPTIISSPGWTVEETSSTWSGSFIFFLFLPRSGN